MEMPGRKWVYSDYRYSHNTHEDADEVFVGAQSAEFWMYDSRIGRRWERDPVVKPWESPYACFSNNPIFFNDLKGLTARPVEGDGKTTIGEPKAKNEPKNYYADEVVVTPASRNFWQKVGDWFKDIGRGFGNLIRKIENGIAQIGPAMRRAFLGKKAQKFEEDRKLEHDNNGNRRDGQHIDQEGDGKLSPENSANEKSDVKEGSNINKGAWDIWDPNDGEKPDADPEARDSEGWTIRPDESNHQKKSGNGNTIFYRNASTGDSVEINKDRHHIKNKNSEEWKEAVRENTPNKPKLRN